MYVITLNKPVYALPKISGVSRHLSLLPTGAIRLGSLMVPVGKSRAFSASVYWPYRKILAELERQGYLTVTRQFVNRGSQESDFDSEPDSEESTVSVENPEPETEIAPADPEVAPSLVAEVTVQPIEETPTDKRPLEDMSVEELKKLCDDNQVAYKANTGKAKLIEKLHLAGIGQI